MTATVYIINKSILTAGVMYTHNINKIKKFKTHQSTSKVIKTNDTASKFQVLTNWCSYCAEKYCIMAHFFLYLHMQ